MNTNIETLIAEFQEAVRSCARHGDKEAFVEEVEATKDALLAALRHADQQSQPQTGMVLAPVEPTGEMLVAGGLEVRKPFELGNTFASRIYKSMIAVIHETN